MLVREVCPEDAGPLAELVTKLGYPVGSAELWQRIERMPAESYHTLVALIDDQVAGFIGLLTLPVYEQARPIGWILALSVSPQHQRRGTGRALLEAAESYYRKRDAIDIRLHSGAQRTEAHEFYEKLGFKKSGHRFRKEL